MKLRIKILIVVIVVAAFSLVALQTHDAGRGSKEKLCQQAVALMEKNDFGAAQKILAQALQIDPQYPKANYALAVCYLRVNPPDLVKAKVYRDKAAKSGYRVPQWFDDYSKKLENKKI